MTPKNPKFNKTQTPAKAARAKKPQTPAKAAKGLADGPADTAGAVRAAVNQTLFSVAVTALAQGLVFLAECPGRPKGGRCRLLRGHGGECLPVPVRSVLLPPKKEG